jgi:membrane protein YdbS with pleckstrin-like domain
MDGLVYNPPQGSMGLNTEGRRPMETQCRSYEVFRRSWLTLIPDWCLALGVLLTMVWSCQRSGLQNERVGLGLAVLVPIVWIVGQTIQWAYSTWTVTTGGRLIVREGFPSRSQQVIHLCSVQDVDPQPPLLARWLGIGHVTFQTIDSRGQVRPFRWKWIGRYRRLCEIIRARGQFESG